MVDETDTFITEFYVQKSIDLAFELGPLFPCMLFFWSRMIIAHMLGQNKVCIVKRKRNTYEYA